MLRATSIRQNLMMVMAGMALAVGASAWMQRPEAVAVTPVPRADELSAAFRSVAAEATPSIVSIVATSRPRQVRQQLNEEDIPAPFREFFRNDPRMEDMFRGRMQSMPPRRGMGSGFIIDASGVILTNNHVVNGADEVKVRLHDGREFIATDIKTDPRTDVAIVRIDAPDLKALKLGDSHATQVGDWVLAIGSPFGLDLSVTAGIISAKGRGNRITERADFLQTDAAINPGNSGGPLLNLHGEVIGINTAIATESGGYDGIGFAIPTHIAGWVSEKLMADGEVRRGYLGTSIQTVDAELARQFNLKVRQGAMVRSVLPDSPAAKAGLEPGDLIVKLNDQPINDSISLQAAVEQLTIGKSYPLQITRNGKPQTLDVTIAEMPKTLRAARADDTEESPEQGSYDKLGLELRPLTKDLARQLGISEGAGLVISGVEEGSPAQAAGLKAGDVVEKAGGEPASTLKAYEAARDKFADTDGLVLNIRSSDGRRYFVVLKAD